MQPGDRPLPRGQTQRLKVSRVSGLQPFNDFSDPMISKTYRTYHEVKSVEAVRKEAMNKTAD